MCECENWAGRRGESSGALIFVSNRFSSLFFIAIESFFCSFVLVGWIFFSRSQLVDQKFYNNYDDSECDHSFRLLLLFWTKEKNAEFVVVFEMKSVWWSFYLFRSISSHVCVCVCVCVCGCYDVMAVANGKWFHLKIKTQYVSFNFSL